MNRLSDKLLIRLNEFAESLEIVAIDLSEHVERLNAIRTRMKRHIISAFNYATRKECDLNRY
jgi:hypothetical protein